LPPHRRGHLGPAPVPRRARQSQRAPARRLGSFGTGLHLERKPRSARQRTGVEERRGERRDRWRAARTAATIPPVTAGHRRSPQLLQPLDQIAEPLLDVLPEPLELANALDQDRFEASGDAARGRLRRTSTPRRAGSCTPAPSRPAAAAAPLPAPADAPAGPSGGPPAAPSPAGGRRGRSPGAGCGTPPPPRDRSVARGP